jgi:hypothetical protein
VPFVDSRIRPRNAHSLLEISFDGFGEVHVFMQRRMRERPQNDRLDNLTVV